jgi:hypothetical protein
MMPALKRKYPLPKFAVPRDPVNLLALQKLEENGEPGSGGPFPALDLVIEALETGNHHLRPGQVFDMQNALYPLLTVRDLKQVLRWSNRVWRDLIDVRSAQHLSKDELANLLVKCLWDRMLALDFSPVSALPINSSRPAM